MVRFEYASRCSIALHEMGTRALERIPLGRAFGKPVGTNLASTGFVSSSPLLLCSLAPPLHYAPAR